MLAAERPLNADGPSFLSISHNTVQTQLKDSLSTLPFSTTTVSEKGQIDGLPLTSCFGVKTKTNSSRMRAAVTERLIEHDPCTEDAEALLEWLKPGERARVSKTRTNQFVRFAIIRGLI